MNLPTTTDLECRIEYIQQPPSTTLGDCNPYIGSGDTIRIALECRARRQTGLTDHFDIRWFRENKTGVVEDLGTGSSTLRTSNGRELVSRYHDTALFNQQYNPSFLGKYWCQVINTTADPDQPLMRSNVFTLLAPENYNGSTCSGSQSVANRTCADLPAQSVKTLPVPATTTDTPSTQEMPIKPTTPLPTIASTQHLPSTILTQQSPSSESTNSDTPVSSTVTYVVVATVLVVLVVSVTVITMVTVLVYKRCSRKQKTGDVLVMDLCPLLVLIKYTTNILFLGQVTSRTNMEMMQSESVESEKIQHQSQEEPQYFNPHYFHHHHPLTPPHSPHYDEAQEYSNKSAHYQPLHTDTKDYTSMYSTTTAPGRRGGPSVEVEGKLYSIVDTTRREEHVYSTPQQ